MTRTGSPLADYFFIAGIESSQICEEKSVPIPVRNADTINEDLELDDTSMWTKCSRAPDPLARCSSSVGEDVTMQQNPEHEKNSGSIDAHRVEGFRVLTTNSSSVIAQASDMNDARSMEEGFEDALRLFAAGRDTFLDEMRSAPDIVLSHEQTRQRSHISQTRQKDSTAVLALKSGFGSLRRRLSSTNSNKGSPVIPRRPPSVHTSKRLSAYNAVMPAPTPIHSHPLMHPLSRRYEPGLLDRYPAQSMTKDSSVRAPFPDYVPMFAFPNDVEIVSSDECPRSTWHGFTMTNSDNTKLHGICLTIWSSLNQTASAALECRCEEWRNINMSHEERELANSLGERLSSERAKLSRLLIRLPIAMSGSAAREVLEEEISAVEERIGLIIDMLHPYRHGAASKIEGLTTGETGLWVPRAYGLIGRDLGLLSFWKEWLKANVWPVTSEFASGHSLTTPEIGAWHPLERYVYNLCIKTPAPISSLTQIELVVGGLHLFARREARNELPGSRNTDLYALFRCLTIPNIITLFEFAMAESRIILLSSHTAMLYLACSALIHILYPLDWAGILVPVLPARLLQALDAPCPFIAGISRQYDDIELPSDDYCIVDLDKNSVEATTEPPFLPKSRRKKLISLLRSAAPHHDQFRVSIGPPLYAKETFPFDQFSTESPHVFTADPGPSRLAMNAIASSNVFQESDRTRCDAPTHNAFLSKDSVGSRDGRSRRGASESGTYRLLRTCVQSSRADSSELVEPFVELELSRSQAQETSTVPTQRRSTDTPGSLALRTTSFRPDRLANLRRPSRLMLGHQLSSSTTTLNKGASSYDAPSGYAQSTLAVSAVIPPVLGHIEGDNDSTRWIEGHRFSKRARDPRKKCNICNECSEDELFTCKGCETNVHAYCLNKVHLVCPVAFNADKVRAAFVRCLASIFCTYRRYLRHSTGEQKRSGMHYRFDMDQFLRSVPHGDSDYMNMLRDTQAFNQFIHERECKKSDDPAIKLFDEIIRAKQNRGKAVLFAKSPTCFLADRTNHIWQNVYVTPLQDHPVSRELSVSARLPARLNTSLMTE